MEGLTNLYPIRNCEYEISKNLVTVLFKKRKLNFVEKIFFKKISSKPYKIDLDKIGSYIWELCDGKFNVGEITIKAQKQFNDAIDPADERVELFIKQMQKNKLITLYEKNIKN